MTGLHDVLYIVLIGKGDLFFVTFFCWEHEKRHFKAPGIG